MTRTRLSLSLAASAAAFLLACSSAPDDGFAPKSSTLIRSSLVAHLDSDFQVPTFVWLEPGEPPPPGTPPGEVARQVLRELAPIYRLSDAALAGSTLRGVHDTGRGVLIAQFDQRVDSQEVFRLSLNVALRRNLQPIAASGYLAPIVKANGRGFVLDERDAINAALARMLDTSSPTSSLSAQGMDPSGHLRFALAPLTVQGKVYTAATPPRVRRTWFPQPSGLLPAYYVELDLQKNSEPDSEMRSFVISAQDGSLLFQKNLTAADAYTYRVYADNSGSYAPWDGPQGTNFTPHPSGLRDGTPLTFVASQLATLQNAPFSRNDPWLPSGATEARGNNAYAYADLVAPDGLSSGDILLTTSAAGKFDYGITPATQEPDSSTTTIKAVTTNFFYIVNYLHDTFYDAGWDEAAGNPQQDNYGRGGVGGDPIRAESQDNSGRNNANASTPADGASPRIQMYLWDRSRNLIVNSPAALARSYENGSAEFGPGIFNLTQDTVIVDDGVSPASNGCETPFVNAAAVTGKIAIIDRGSCTFHEKAANAQANGAVGVVIVNNQPSPPQGMPAADPPPALTVTIPSLMIGQAEGTAIKTALTGGMTVNLTLLSAYASNDSSLDGTIASHEWGHVLSNRLIGNASGLGNTQGNGMGEGWSDFVALLTIVRPEDAAAAANSNWNGTFAVSAYSAGPGNNAAYDGIRRYPYSADLTKNPLSFQYVQEGVPLPATPTPLFGADGVGNSEVHSTGEVWTSMLWDCYVALLRDTARYSFAQANRTMRDYLVASLKLTPINPTILEARDAVLAAAYANDAQDFQLFASAFARRGAGIGAIGPDRLSQDNTGVTESNMVGGNFEIVSIKLDDSVFPCDKDGVLDNNEVGKLTVTIRNTGTVPISVTATVNSSSSAVTLSKNSIGFSTIPPFATTSATVNATMQGAAVNQPFDITVVGDATGLAVPGAITATESFHGNYDVVYGTSANDSMDDRNPVWSIAFDPNLDTSQPWYHDDRQGTWSIPDTGATSDHYLISPPLNVAGTGNFGFTLSHRYAFEADASTNYDGAVIELSSDNGATWNDIGAALTANGYTGQIWDPGSLAEQPLRLRQGFTATSSGYPAFIVTTADLGTAYQGQTVRLRFRVGTDPGGGFTGWDLDSVSFSGITNTPFSTRIPGRALCANRAPQASGGPDQVVAPGVLVTLAGQAFDPDGDPLTYRWTQSSGPMVTLSDAQALSPTFMAPQVDTATTLTFTLVVNDGLVDSVPTIAHVTVAPPKTPTPSMPMPTPPTSSGCSTALGPSGLSGYGLAALLFFGGALLLRRRRALPLALLLLIGQGCGSDAAPAQIGLFVTRSGTGDGHVTSAPGGIDCGNACAAVYNPGTQVVLSAAAADGSQFVGWKGACSGSSSTCTVSLDMSANVEAIFDGLPTTLSVTKSSAGDGSVTSDPAGLDCGVTCQKTFTADSMVTLTATPDAQSEFLGWSGDCQGLAETCTLRLNASRSAVATFAPRLCSADGLCWERPLPQGNSLFAVQVLGINDVWVAGERGLLVHWNGKRWSYRSSGTAQTLRAMWAHASDDIFAAGDGGALVHWDGSAWTAVTSGVTTNLYGLWGAAQNDIWAVGDGGVVLHYNGTAWTTSSAGAASDESLRAISGSSSGNVWAVSDQGNVFNWDGTQWTQSNVSVRRLLGVFTGSASDVWAVGDFGDAWHWDGSMWNDASIGGSASLLAVFAAGSELWATKSDNQLLHFNGSAWKNVDNQVGSALYAVHGSSGNLWFVGGRGAIARWDGGTLSAVSTGSETRGFSAVWGSSDNIWFVGAGGQVGRYTGGLITSSESGVKADLLAVHGSAATDIWAVGTGGTAVHYVGGSWQTSSTGTPHLLHAVWSNSATDSWAVGELGTVLHHDGSGWSAMATGATDDLYAVFSSGAKDTWIAGASELYHHNGTAWSKQTGVSGPLYALNGRSSSDVFAAGAGGALYHFDGSTWTAVTSGTSVNLRSIAFSSSSEMWLAGEQGVVLVGATNQLAAVQSGTSGNLYSVWAGDPRNVWITGSSGILSHRR